MYPEYTHVTLSEATKVTPVFGQHQPVDEVLVKSGASSSQYLAQTHAVIPRLLGRPRIKIINRGQTIFPQHHDLID